MCLPLLTSRTVSRLRRWSLSRAWPVKFLADDWDNESLIGSVTLTYDFFEPVAVVMYGVTPRPQPKRGAAASPLYRGDHSMAVMFSYNFTEADSVHNSRMQSMFERFGWQNVGGSCYRYPALNAGQVWPEDWFNKVLPALMCFRAYVLKQNLAVPKFSLDANASTGFDASVSVGDAPKAVTKDDFAPAENHQFGAKNLVDWLQAVTDEIPY